VTLINLGGQRLGSTAETRETRDLEQARVAIEAVRVLMPLIAEWGEAAQPLRDALAQLQLVYAREVGAGGEADAEKAAGPPPKAGEAGEPSPESARERPRSSGRLWTPPGSSG
jgi:hypothetical protein